ncbi:MAG: hypothetical protein V3U30_04220 [Thermoplasmata archaeon]
MRGGRMPLAGALAVTSGAVGIAAALLSLLSVGDMGMPMNPMMPAGSLPAWLLLVFGGVVLGNGVLLLAGVGIAARPQGGLMLFYGGLMVLVGWLMLGTDLFAMQMANLSALAMFGLGGLMVVSGIVMVAGKPMGERRPA